MDWLFDQGIVFDILPDDTTARKIATSSKRIQALACLTYLENEPDQESIPMWHIVSVILVGAGGYAAVNIFDSTVVGAIGLAVLLMVLLVTFEINRHTKNIAAWANSWSTAIKECSPPVLQKEDSQSEAQKKIHNRCHFQKLTARISEGGFTDRCREPFCRQVGASLSERRDGTRFGG